MARKRNKGPIRMPHKRIALGIYELANCQQAPSPKALRLFLIGDDLVSDFSLLDGYGAFKTLSPRKLGVYLKTLEENGYVRIILDRVYGENYLYLTQEGNCLAEEFQLKKKPSPIKQTRPKPLFKRMDD